MQKVRRIALLIAGIIFALLVVALLAVNLYVQSAPTQARIQDELSQRLGATLRIQRISVTPWFGLKLTGITMPQDDEATGDFLRAQTFRLRVRIGSLFAQRLVINEVSLIKPNVVWAQNADGKWRLPTQVARANEEAAIAVPATRAAAPVPTAAPPAQAASSAAVPASSAASEHTGRFTPEVRRVRLVDGSFRFLDAKRKPVATFEGVRFESGFRNATALRGNASIDKVSLRNRFFLEQLQSPVKYDATELDLSEISARAAGGEVSGRFRMNPSDPESPFSVLVRFRDLNADRLISDAHGPAGMLQGRLEGSLEASGQTADPNALTGAGEIFLHDGQVRQYSLLVALGQLLQMKELEQLRFNQARVRYHINPGVVMVDDMLLTSRNMRLSAVGTIDFEGRLQLDARLAISDSMRKQLFRPMRSSFQPTSEEGFTAVDFAVSGTVEHPRTDLMDKIVGPELKDLSGVISGFLGGR
ncbi:MAG: AsmA family protein, partial [Chthoniobacterales bacterium]